METDEIVRTVVAHKSEQDLDIEVIDDAMCQVASLSQGEDLVVASYAQMDALDKWWRERHE